ncbi:MAG: hypothetical protein RO469_03655 [Thermincola sp.]|jgi:hypothetical protein|nr:hypothetical protein [Thermincola sp.]MDT3704389.1 hypothetical protein [Thermincola sp.]
MMNVLECNRLTKVKEILASAAAFYKNWDMGLATRLFDYFSLNPRQSHGGLSVRKDFYRALLKDYLQFPRSILLYRSKDFVINQFRRESEGNDSRFSGNVFGRQVLYLTIPRQVQIDDAALGTNVIVID